MVDGPGVDVHAASVGVTGDGLIVGDAAPRDRSAVNVQACAVLPPFGQPATRHRDALEPATVAYGRATGLAPGCCLLDNRVLPSPTNKRDATSHHQLGVDLKSAVAESDGTDRIRNRSRINRILDFKPSGGGGFFRRYVGKGRASSAHKPHGERRCNAARRMANAK